MPLLSYRLDKLYTYMKTQDILTLPEAKLAPQLAHLKVKELERHAQKILLKNGGGDYNQLIRTIIQTIPKLSAESDTPYQEVQKLVRAELEHSYAINDIAERLSVIIMVIVTKKFQKIHNG